jgi:ZIP family zinc transporter
MTELTIFHAMALAALAGLAMPLGAVAALIERRRFPGGLSRFEHTVTAFGGGALVSAVALVLVPEGAHDLPPVLAVVLFCAGGQLFFAIDLVLARQGGAGAQLLAMLLDYLPEAAALGAALVIDPPGALLIAGLIFLQNLPEGFSAFREIAATGRVPARWLIMIFTALAAIGPVFAALGMTVLSGQPMLLGGIMITAAGGVLYLVFEDIAPAVRTEGALSPPLGAVAGFALGLAGYLATQ